MTESIAEKNLSKEAQKMLKDMRGSRTDMDFMVADFENGDNAKDILAQSDKEFTVFSQRKKWRRWHPIPNIMLKRCIVLKVLCVCRMKSMLSLDLKEHFGKTNGIENSADTDTKITKFGISLIVMELQHSLLN